MAIPEQRTFGLPADQASYIDSLMKSGNYASESEVVQAGLIALRKWDATIETWLRDDVAPVYDAMKADPGRAIPADDVFATVRDIHTQRLKTAKRALSRSVFTRSAAIPDRDQRSALLTNVTPAPAALPPPPEASDPAGPRP